MPLMPMMPEEATGNSSYSGPGSAAGVASPAPGPPSNVGGQPEQGALANLLGPSASASGPSTMGGGMGGGEMMGTPGMGSSSADPTGQLLQAAQTALEQFQQVETTIMDLAGLIPGTEMMAQQVMMIIQQWKQMALVNLSQAPQQMPGAQQML